MKWNTIKNVEIFQTGSRIDGNGNFSTKTIADLKHIAKYYDPATHEAPIIYGHSADDFKNFLRRDHHAADGWVKRLWVDGESLYADLDVSPELEEAMKNKFKKRSVGLYKPGNPGSPNGSGFYLRHLAVLGASPPNIKGMKDIFTEYLEELNAEKIKPLRLEDIYVSLIKDCYEPRTDERDYEQK